MQNSIKKMQLAFILIAIIPGGKLLSLPGLMAHFSGRDSWISMAIMFAIDLLCLIFMLWAITINKGKDLNEILTETLSPVVAKIIFALYAMFFMLRIMGGLLDTLELMSSTLSVVTNWVAFIIPILIVVGFNVFKGMMNMARLTQILFAFIFLSGVLIFLLSIKNTDFENITPYVADGWGKVIEGASNGSFWFSDAVFIIFLVKDVTKGKYFKSTIFSAYVIGVVMTLLLDITFLSLFGSLSEYASSAIAKVSGFNVQASTSGRLDWIFVVIWLSSIILKSSMFLWAATKSLDCVFGVKTAKGHKASYLGICAVFVLLPLFVPIKNFIYECFDVGWGKYVAYIVQYLIPVMLPFLTLISNKKHKLAQDDAQSGDGKLEGANEKTA